MTDEQQPYSTQALNKFRQWHFWWLVIFSLLLTITFVYYLPTRFLQQAGAPHTPTNGMPIDESQPHGHDASGNSIPSGQNEDHMTNEEMDEHMSEGMSMNEMMDDHVEEGHEAVYLEEQSVKQGLAVNLNVNPVPYNSGVPLSMSFFVNQKPGSISVFANQLQIEHEKLMHVIGVRSDMNEFFHVHPEFLADNPAIFRADHIFSKPGLYKIWSEIKKDGVNYSFGHPEVNINGLGLREEKKVSFSRNVITGNYQVSLEVSDAVAKGREVDLSFDIHSLTGMEIEVEQYLGADMHLSIIRDDLKQFIHTHPEGHSHSWVPSLVDIALAHGEEEPVGATDEHQANSSGD